MFVGAITTVMILPSHADLFCIPTKFVMIRSIAPDDTTALIALAEATGLFGPHETEELALMLADHFGGETNSQDIWITDDDDELVGVAYVAPERMTDGTL